MASFASRLFRRPVRTLAMMAGGTTGVLASQMLWVRYQFQLPPEAGGPSSGVCRAGSDADAQRGVCRRRRNIVFLGDSIVTGVGCSAAASDRDGPVLPRVVAGELAQSLGDDVGWVALGETGADVSMLRDELLPSLRAEAERAQTAGERIDAVVVLTGLNDIKSCFLFANPSKHPISFRSGLSSLFGSIRELVGARCALVVAGTPLDACPRFQDYWPLGPAMRGVVWVWELQKKGAVEDDAARAAEPARFVEAPPGLVQPHMFASDGMHPNDAGYAAWGELMAARLLPLLRES